MARVDFIVSALTKDNLSEKIDEETLLKNELSKLLSSLGYKYLIVSATNKAYHVEEGE